MYHNSNLLWNFSRNPKIFFYLPRNQRKSFTCDFCWSVGKSKLLYKFQQEEPFQSLGGNLRSGIFLVQLHFMESPLFQRHVFIDTNTVSLVFGIDENHHANRLDYFVDQHIAELEGCVEHGGIIGKDGTSPSKFKLVKIAGSSKHGALSKLLAR